MRNVTFSLWPFLLFVLLMQNGCSHTINSKEVFGQINTGSPLKGEKEISFSFKGFQDMREKYSKNLIIEPSLWGFIRTNKIYYEDTVPNIVSSSIKGELERNGHKCYNYEEKMDADYIVEGIVTIHVAKFTSNDLLLQSKFDAVSAINLSISRNNDAKEKFEKLFIGKYHLVHHRIGGPNLYDAMREAHQQLLRNISTDTDLISFIKNTRK